MKMDETTVNCPNCGVEIPVSEVLTQKLRAEIEETYQHKGREQLKQAVTAAKAEVRNALELELKDLRSQLDEKEQRMKKAQEQELQLRKKARELEARQKEFDLEVQRRLDVEKHKLEENLRESLGQEQALKLRQKEKQINDLRRSLEEAKRKSELGSQELQGEVLELDIEAALVNHFPSDEIQPVPKGMHARRGHHPAG
ncbi:MAG: DUF2130 domain-containing protein [Gammaproteobacteria bacterium]